MAAFPEIRTIPNTPVLAGQQNNNSQNRNLPRGACNYRDKDRDGQICGCQQYFDEETFGRSGQGSLWFCNCGHHACYHDQNFAGDRTFASHNSQSQHMQVGNDPEQRPRALDPFLGYTNASNTQLGSQGCRGDLDFGIAFPTLQNSLPDTLSWNPSAQLSPDLLPPIPPQCLLPSQERIDRENEQGAGGTQSTGSVISNEKRKLADLRTNLFLPVQNKAPPSSDSTKQQKITSTQESISGPQTALHHAQRQLTVTSDEDGAATDVENGGDNLLPAEVLRRILSPIRSIRREVVNLSTVVKAHGQRLDSMENFSFSTTDSSDVHGRLQEKQEEIEDRFQSVEIRQDEFDGRLIDIENSRDNDSSGGSVLQRIGDRDSLTGGSFASSVINAASDPSLIVALRTQISDLQAELQAAIPPTRDRPWIIEVVFLPFGSSLKGIWSTIDDFPSQVSRRNSMAADEWIQSQTPTRSSSQTKQPLTERSGSWEGVVAKQNHGGEYLVARSCNRNSKIYARLKSRGCIRVIEIRGPQAKDVEAALVESLGDLPEILSGRDGDHNQKRRSRLTKTYHALQSSWIPLRKLHKDSRLRFLDPSELISETLWTVEFLKSSVVMRATELPILFLTHPQGYTQHLTSSEDNWTWPKIRLMPRVNLDSDETEVKEADAYEPCWKFDERFDSHESVQSSFTSAHSLSIRQAPIEGFHNPTSHSDHFSSAAASPLGTPTSSERIVTPIHESRNARAKLRRTTSVPVFVPLQERPSLSKRKTSYYPEVHSKSSPEHVPMHLNQKRRRISRSPSRPRNTPRWSTGPHDYEDDPGVAVTSIRGTTPFAYATPHSADYAEYRAFLDEDEDDEGSTTDNGEFDVPMNEFDSSFEAAEQDDTVWEGVEDGSYDNNNNNNDDDDDDDNNDNDDASSDSSAAPSEYPSTKPPMGYGRSGAFQLHVDEDDDFDASRKG